MGLNLLTLISGGMLRTNAQAGTCTSDCAWVVKQSIKHTLMPNSLIYKQLRVPTIGNKSMQCWKYSADQEASAERGTVNASNWWPCVENRTFLIQVGETGYLESKCPKTRTYSMIPSGRGNVKDGVIVTFSIGLSLFAKQENWFANQFTRLHYHW